ncbi:MAG: malto-oligosyltrehalose synthase [Pirellulales bacterium]|nr:malto-oligosyltrehalose synthase [Pirellulales bacterium]
MPESTSLLPAAEHLIAVNRIPWATYRLQLRPGFGFEQVRALLPYLEALGISDLYLSPLFRARAGSTHGYDVVDHTQIEPAFGGEEAFVAMADQARAAGMGIVLDVVPNHMGINEEGNRYWLDVLENGEGSRWADFFDIDWDAIPLNLKHRVLQPVLGKSFGATLEAGELKIVYQQQRLQVAYFDRLIPLTPRTWPVVLQLVSDRLYSVAWPGDSERRGGESPGAPVAPLHDRRQARIEHAELESIISQLRNLPPGERRDADAIRTRYREQRIARRRLAHLVQKRPRVRQALDEAIHEVNGAVGNPASFNRLEELLTAQHYRLAYWRVASDEINYRRFFDINDLAAIRVEDPRVFNAVHRLVADLVARNLVTGLRIDHPDGLLDPSQYFDDLQSLYRRSRPDNGDEAARQIYIVAEKILSGNEQLDPQWAVQGTTGYDFLNLVNRLLVDDDGIRQIRDDYEEMSGVEEGPAEILYQSKKAAARVLMLSEMQMLAARLYRIAQRQRASRDFTQPTLLRALAEVVASLAVYRTYVPPRGWEASEEDHRRINLAVRLAKRRNPDLARSLFDFIASVLLLQFPPALEQEDREAWRHFALKLQQVSGPIAAKGVEDTAFYRYYPLASLNEVGAELDAGALRAAEFHRLMHHRAANWPHGMSGSSTHDAKRSEDVRARLHVLSEIPRAWKDAVLLWRQMNRRWLQDVDGEPIPDANEEYLLYQSLVGVWPLEPLDDRNREELIGRIAAYMEKALREAKRHTSWVNPSEDYEAAVLDFVRKILSPEAAAFQTDLSQFVAGIADAGFVNALSQVLLKTTLPGVPDFYQGTELWDFSLVDPDNRRPVDYDLRQRLLAEIADDAAGDLGQAARAAADRWPDPQIKLLVTSAALHLRRRWPEVFARGGYTPVETIGPAADHLFAFARQHEGRWSITAVPLGFHRLTRPNSTATPGPAGGLPRPAWGDTALVLPDAAPRRWRSQFAGESLQCLDADDPPTLRAADLFDTLPVALITASEE